MDERHTMSLTPEVVKPLSEMPPEDRALFAIRQQDAQYREMLETGWEDYKAMRAGDGGIVTPAVKEFFTRLMREDPKPELVSFKFLLEVYETPTPHTAPVVARGTQADAIHDLSKEPEEPPIIGVPE